MEDLVKIKELNDMITEEKEASEPSAAGSGKPKMTDEERRKLAAKLDAELDEFINGLEKRRYAEGWPEDKWQEEFDKHPFFMKQAPGPNDELSPLMQGLQKLKYDPEENTAEELAGSYKEDGNYNFKYKNYRLAIVAYTEGIKAKCDNSEINAVLYNNRGAAHYFLKNYRSCLNDCEKALTYKPDYIKALYRAANCALLLSRYDKCVEFCDQILLKDNENKEFLDLRKKAIKEQNFRERNSRKAAAAEKLRKFEEQTLLGEINKRGIQIESIRGKQVIDLAELEPTFPEIAQHRVFLDNEQNLIWPVIFLYPEYKTMDFVQQFNENTTLKEHLSVIFESTPEWDHQGKYGMTNLNVYFEAYDSKKMIIVDMNKTLGDMLKNKKYVVRGGVPSFMVFAKNSPAEKSYLSNC